MALVHFIEEFREVELYILTPASFSQFFSFSYSVDLISHISISSLLALGPMGPYKKPMLPNTLKL